MRKLKFLFLTFSVLLFVCETFAQNTKYECITCKNDTLIKEIRVYGGLIHQHQDFFNKAFSFQGVESGLVINRTLLAGAFGSMFVSNLDVSVATYPHLFVNIGEGGLFVGKVNNNSKVIHTGWLLNMGYFSLVADDADFALFQANNPLIKLNGLVLSPQVFAEMNISKWMKLRTGLIYSFYSFEDHSVISKSDLNNISLTFGFIFGKFN